ncbi:Polo-like kinase [Mitosporidium daphniae]|uniref:Polo-like kinase n=1 Tax=Mitosporidium daphniae TaxID=1485682 RepID=A0A098VR48_9MICR|nr:Polo-like kinase [Mitosporidium daphniae]KGG51294.1 Polo-like kinase [Mitosporidium daphniae]|eukprot:XP_013237721.1 Polo-like kinase [Mitosporidium daphniae]
MPALHIHAFSATYRAKLQPSPLGPSCKCADRNFPDPPHVIVHHGFTFKLGKKLGEGGFAKCFEVIDELSGKRLALKAIFLDSVVKLKAQSKARLAVLTNRYKLRRNFSCSMRLKFTNYSTIDTLSSFIEFFTMSATSTC